MAAETPSAQELLAAASGLASNVERLAGPEGTPFEAVKFSTEFKSKQWPQLDGTVVIRYPTWGDVIKIEGMAMGLGTVAEITATLLVCIEKAPASWWYLPEGAKKPTLNLSAIPDSDGLQGLWFEFLAWRRTFRGKGV